MLDPRQERSSTACTTGCFDAIEEMSPEKAVATSSPTTWYSIKSPTVPNFTDASTPRYNPSRAYPRPRRVLPDVNQHLKMRKARTDASFPYSLYSTPTTEDSPLTASGSRSTATFSKSRRRLEGSLSPRYSSPSQSPKPFLTSNRRSDASRNPYSNLHSTPAVSAIGLTVSSSTREISQPRTSQSHRSRLSLVDLAGVRANHNSSRIGAGTGFSNIQGQGPRRVQFQPHPNIRARVSVLPTDPALGAGHFPTRIPSPSASSPNHPERRQIRLSSTPVLPSQHTSKENIVPKGRQLLGQISPTTANRGAPGLPRAKTFGVFVSLTTAFSRSSSRQASSSAQSINEHPWDAIFKAPVPEEFDGYWTGRFVGKVTIFQNQELSENLSRVDKLHMSGRSVNSEVDYDRLLTDSDLRVLRVFKELDELCVTSEAKKSLWDWQLLYARLSKNEKFLPNGGTMINARGSWVSRMGKAIKQEGKELGKKTSMAFRIRNSGDDLEKRL